MGLSINRSRNFQVLRLSALLCAAVSLLTSCVPAQIPSGVYIASIANGEPKWIGAPAAAPVWSPDGSAIAWGSERGIYIGQPKGDLPRQLTESPVAGKPAWSPDATRLAYVDIDQASLFVIDTSTGEKVLETPIVNSGAPNEPTALVSIGGPSWSPDGATLAFICWDGRGDEVCLIEADGSERRQVTHIEPIRRSTTSNSLTTPAGANVGPPIWAPDGNSIAVPAFAEVRGNASGIFIVLLDQGIARRVTALQPTSDVVWASDGSSLLFSASVEGRSDVYRISASGGLADNLTRSLPEGARDPALSPDGRELAVASGRDIQILGPEERKLGASDESMRERFPAWSPDSNELAFSSSPALVTKYD